MNASGSGTTLVALDTSRVRVDPRLLSPLPAATQDGGFRVLVGGAATREEAEANEKEIQKITGEDAHAAYDTETKTWGMFVGGKLSREEAEEFRARLETAGIDATIEGKEHANRRAKSIDCKQQPCASDFATGVAVTRSRRFVRGGKDVQLECASLVCNR